MSLDGFKRYELKDLRKKYNVEEFNVGSYRIKKGVLTVDYFPKRKKFSNHNTQERGIVNGTIKQYVKGWLAAHTKIDEQKALPIQNEDKRVFLTWIINRYKVAQAELKETYGTDKKQLLERLKNLKALYIKENIPTTNNNNT